MARTRNRSLLTQRYRKRAQRNDIQPQKAVKRKALTQKAVKQGPAVKPKQRAVHQKAVKRTAITQKAVPKLRYRGIERDHDGQRVKVYTSAVKRRRKKR